MCSTKFADRQIILVRHAWSLFCFSIQPATRMIYKSLGPTRVCTVLHQRMRLQLGLVAISEKACVAADAIYLIVRTCTGQCWHQSSGAKA